MPNGEGEAEATCLRRSWCSVASQTSGQASTSQCGQLLYPLPHFRLKSVMAFAITFSLLFRLSVSYHSFSPSSSHIHVSPDSFLKLLFFSSASSCSLSLDEPRLIHNQKRFTLHVTELLFTYERTAGRRPTHWASREYGSPTYQPGQSNQSARSNRKPSESHGHPLFT